MAAPPAVRPLRGPNAFTEILASPQRARAAGYRAWARVDPGASDLFLGVGASKRNFPRAVDRNRLKRLVRASALVHRESLAGYRIVVLVDRQPVPVRDGRRALDTLARLWRALLAQNAFPPPRQTPAHSP